MPWIPLNEEELLQNPKIKAAYDAKSEEFEIVEEMIKARIAAGLTQEQVAEKMGTSQAYLSRIEGGKNVSLNSLRKYAKATGKRVKVTFI